MRGGATRMLAGVLVAAAVLAACGGPSENELAYAREQERERVLDEIDRQPVWIGTVRAFEDTLYDPITFDFGGRYPVEIDVARIAPVDCPSVTASGNSAEYTAFLRERAPVGARFALVRSQDEFGTLDSEGFLRYLGPDGTPDTTRPTVNEEMLVAGVAQPEPRVTARPSGDYESVERTIATERDQMSAGDFAYWTRFVEIYLRADEQRVGAVGACATAEIEQKERSERETRESEERIRRWELGPDGRRDTPDDFTDYDGDGRRDTGGGSGGDGFDIPDGLCPTRFC